MSSVSPTLEGFRVALRRPSLALAEIMWRWSVGATAVTLFFFGLFEFLNTLPVTSGDLLFLRTRQPYLVGQALAHILRGSLNRAVLSAMLAGMLLAVLWIIAASLGRIATVRALLDYFRSGVAFKISLTATPTDLAGRDVSNVSTISTLARLNFLRVVVVLAAIFGFLGAAIVAGFASPDAHPRPGLAFFLFLPLAALICLIGGTLNWFLSLAALFAVRDGEDPIGAISGAASICRERSGAVVAVSTWSGLAHLVLFGGASTVVSMPLSAAGVLPGRIITLAVLLVTLAYFAVVDWLYMARLAGYVCITEMPEELIAPAAPPIPPSPLQTTIDRDEPILSDVPGLMVVS